MFETLDTGQQDNPSKCYIGLKKSFDYIYDKQIHYWNN